jgi:hypothetical protein
MGDMFKSTIPNDVMADGYVVEDGLGFLLPAAVRVTMVGLQGSAAVQNAAVLSGGPQRLPMGTPGTSSNCVGTGHASVVRLLLPQQTTTGCKGRIG